MINSHFRAELNVGNDQPIPRLSVQRGNEVLDNLIDKKLNLNENELRDAIVRDDVHFNGRQTSATKKSK